MASIATTVAVAAVLIIVVFLVFEATARGVPRNRSHEVEVKLLFATIRRKVDVPGDEQEVPDAPEDTGESCEAE